jgi:hypothetical protein
MLQQVPTHHAARHNVLDVPVFSLLMDGLRATRAGVGGYDILIETACWLCEVRPRVTVNVATAEHEIDLSAAGFDIVAHERPGALRFKERADGFHLNPRSGISLPETISMWTSGLELICAPFS